MNKVQDSNHISCFHQLEISFESSATFTNPYTDNFGWVTFLHDDGKTIVRPMFWAGGSTWKVRFAPTLPGNWSWRSESKIDDSIHGKVGSIKAQAGECPTFWTIPPGSKNIRNQWGQTDLIVADTAWALPWRATPEQVLEYAKDRQSKGFNATLLMSIQPDMEAIGPSNRTENFGFAVGFHDLPTGHLNALNPTYFEELDELIEILVSHGITPVWSPVFHGYGWRGKQTIGNQLDPDEYARYCQYLIARYGAQPAIWLASADGSGLAPSIDHGGKTFEKWDEYQHPTGLHYGPHWNPSAHQDKKWLDFQWLQTGHDGIHIQHRLAVMSANQPPKAIANGEPTYENIGRMGKAAGWWQGNEAWMNLMAGGTMGVIYGAGSLWQWRLNQEEMHESWCQAPDADWKEALHFEGSRYVGFIRTIFSELDFAEIAPDFSHTFGRLGLFLADQLFIVYLPHGGYHSFADTTGIPKKYRVYDLKSCQEFSRGEGHEPIAVPTDRPYVIVYSKTYVDE